MIWFVYVFVAALLGSIEKLYNRWCLGGATKEQTVNYFLAFNVSALFVSLIMFGPTLNNSDQIVVIRENMLILVGAGSLWVGASFLAFWADRHIEANLSTIISQSKIVASVVIGYMMGSSFPTKLQITGIVLIMFSLAPRLKEIKALETFSFMAKLLSIVMLVSAFAVDKWLMSKGVSKFVLLFSGYGIPILAAILMQVVKGEIKSFLTNKEQRNYLWLGSISGLLSVCFYLSILESLSHGDLARTMVLITSMLFLSSMGAALLLKESFSIKRHAISIILLLLGNILYYL